MVERHVANVGVAGSSPVSCSRKCERPRLVRSGAFSLGVLATCDVQPNSRVPRGHHLECRRPPFSSRAASSISPRQQGMRDAADRRAENSIARSSNISTDDDEYMNRVFRDEVAKYYKGEIVVGKDGTEFVLP